MFRNFHTSAHAIGAARIGPVSWVQIGLALSALGSAWMAIRASVLAQASGQAFCLGAPQGSLLAATGHCPWCYAALTLMAVAAWPVRLGAQSRALGKDRVVIGL